MASSNRRYDMNPIQPGFTLIELVILITIASIGVGVAAPAYRDYVIRERISEAILATSQCRTVIADVYQSVPRNTSIGTNKWSCGEGLTTTKYVASISTDPAGTITVMTSVNTLLGAAASTSLTLTPTKEDGTALSIRDIPTKVYGFKCAPGGATPVPAKYLPDSCRG